MLSLLRASVSKQHRLMFLTLLISEDPAIDVYYWYFFFPFSFLLQSCCLQAYVRRAHNSISFSLWALFTLFTFLCKTFIFQQGGILLVIFFLRQSFSFLVSFTTFYFFSFFCDILLFLDSFSLKLCSSHFSCENHLFIQLTLQTKK